MAEGEAARETFICKAINQNVQTKIKKAKQSEVPLQKARGTGFAGPLHLPPEGGGGYTK